MAALMRTSNRNYAATVPFVEALTRLGLQHAAITPGSRNTPLAFAFAANPDVTDSSHHDERSAGFFALGMARSTRRPVALVCTSGTAAAEYLPAIIEGRNARIPLIVLTADRPPETRDVGAPQTIDQHGMYGRAVKWSYEAPVPQATPDIINAFTALAGRAWSAAIEAPMGPVHLNLPFRDPLAPIVVAGDVPDDLPEPLFPSYSPSPPATPPIELIERVFNSFMSRKTLMIAGPTDDPGFAAPAAELATRGQIPVVADPLSGLRTGNHDLTNVISTGDWLARRGDLDNSLRPELVLRFGATPTSKSLTDWLAANRDVEQILFEEAGWRDPSASADHLIRSDPTGAATMLAARINEPVNPAWVDQWRRAETAIIEGYDVPFPSEPAVVRALNASLPSGAALWIASSMPIRIMDAFFTPIGRDVSFYGNRGANGIDGLISSALGTAVGTSRPTYVYAGDLSTLHDLTALATAVRMKVPVTVVLVNNDGGGIFHLLPQVDFPEAFEKHLGTPHGLDFSKIAEAFGIEHQLPTTSDALGDLIATPSAGPRIIEIQTDRQTSADLLHQMWQQVADS